MQGVDPASCSRCIGVRGAAQPLYVLWSKAAEALSTTPSKGVTFAGCVLWSKAAEALSTTPSKGVTFAGYCRKPGDGHGLRIQPACALAPGEARQVLRRAHLSERSALHRGNRREPPGRQRVQGAAADRR